MSASRRDWLNRTAYGNERLEFKVGGVIVGRVVEAGGIGERAVRVTIEAIG